MITFTINKIKISLVSLLISLLSISEAVGQVPVESLGLGVENKASFETLAKARWDQKQLLKGVVWKHKHFENLFDSKQNITVFTVDLNDPEIEVDIPFLEQGFMTTSEAADKSDALVAINGSFFDTKIGGSVVFLRRDGVTINPTRDGFREFREYAGFGLTVDGQPVIVEKPNEGWESSDVIPNILSSGPLLLIDGEKVPQLPEAFNLNRHPRTAIGITADNKLMAVVVDGRASKAHGMSIEELSVLMDALGCQSAMNLDGGGSSTAWVKEKGVVNYPSDNKTFDNEGERGVANAIIIRAVE